MLAIGTALSNVVGKQEGKKFRFAAELGRKVYPGDVNQNRAKNVGKRIKEFMHVAELMHEFPGIIRAATLQYKDFVDRAKKMGTYLRDQCEQEVREFWSDAGGGGGGSGS